MVGVIDGKGSSLTCCKESMTELVANTVDASMEKHLPAVTVSGDSINVQIGSAPHPMENEHNIKFVYVETKRGGQRKALNVGENPTAVFNVAGDEPVAAYAYCNLHGLWKTDIK